MKARAAASGCVGKWEDRQTPVGEDGRPGTHSTEESIDTVVHGLCDESTHGPGGGKGHWAGPGPGKGGQKPRYRWRGRARPHTRSRACCEEQREEKLVCEQVAPLGARQRRLGRSGLQHASVGVLGEQECRQWDLPRGVAAEWRQAWVNSRRARRGGRRGPRREGQGRLAGGATVWAPTLARSPWDSAMVASTRSMRAS